jgi:hypothetical protein
MTAHGLPDWSDGEEVLVFLESSLPGRYRIAGLSQGKFEIERDAASGAVFVRRTALGLERVERSGKRASSDGSLRVPLNALLHEALPDSPRFGEGR